MLYLLLFLSLLSVAVMAERATFLLRRRTHIAALLMKLQTLLDDGGFDAARKAFATDKTMEGRVIHAGLEKHTDRKSVV